MEKVDLAPDIVERFANYYEFPGNGSWGSLHIVLADGNVRDSSVVFCRDLAKEHGDVEGEALAELLMRMSKSQRGRLDWKVSERQNARRRRKP